MTLHRFRFKAMGCPCALQIHARSEREARAWAASARGEIERLEQKYSRYRDDSLLSQINASAGDRGRARGRPRDRVAARLRRNLSRAERWPVRHHVGNPAPRLGLPVRPPARTRADRRAALARRMGEGALVGLAHRASARGHGAGPGRLREGVRRRPRRCAAAQRGLPFGPGRSRRRSRDRRPAPGRPAVDRRDPRRVASGPGRAVGAGVRGRRRHERRLRALHGRRRRALRTHPRPAHGLARGGPRERHRVRPELPRRRQRIDDRAAPGRASARMARRARAPACAPGARRRARVPDP